MIYAGLQGLKKKEPGKTQVVFHNQRQLFFNPKKNANSLAFPMPGLPIRDIAPSTRKLEKQRLTHVCIYVAIKNFHIPPLSLIYFL